MGLSFSKLLKNFYGIKNSNSSNNLERQTDNIIKFSNAIKAGNKNQENLKESINATNQSANAQSLTMDALSFALNVGLSAAIGLIISKYQEYKQEQQEIHDKSIQAIDDAQSELNTIYDLYQNYVTLSDEFKSNSDAKNDLVTATSDLLTALGLEYSQIDDLIAKYGTLDEAIRMTTLDALSDDRPDLTIGYKTAQEDFIDSTKNSFFGRNVISSGGKKEMKFFDILNDAGILSSYSYGPGGGSLVLPDISDEKGALGNYQKLKDALDAFDAAANQGIVTWDELGESTLYKKISKRFKSIKDKYDIYESSVSALNDNLATSKILSSLDTEDLPENVDEFNAYQQELINAALAGNEFVGTQEEIEASFKRSLAKMPEFKEYFTDYSDAQKKVSKASSDLSFESLTCPAFTV